MAMPRASRMRLVWGLELALGLELYACAVLALHARGLRAAPLDASPALVLPALVIPPVFYVLVGLVSARPPSIVSILRAAAAMCGLHALLVMATGALFMIPDLLDYAAAVAFALWGSPAVTLLQLTAAPLLFARLKPLLSPRAVPVDARVAHQRPEAPPILGALPPLGGPNADLAAAAARAAVAQQRERAAAQAQARPATPKAAVVASTIAPSAPTSPVVGSPAPAGQVLALAPSPVVVPPPVLAKPSAVKEPAPPPPVMEAAAPPCMDSTPESTPSEAALERRLDAPSPVVVPPPALVKPSAVKEPAPPPPVVEAAAPPRMDSTRESTPSETAPERGLDATQPMIRVPFDRIADQLPVEMFARGREGLEDTLRPGDSLLVPRDLLLPHLGEGLAPVKWDVVADQFPLDALALDHDEIAARLPDGSLLLPLDQVIPQIPETLLALQTPLANVREIEEFPEPFQPSTPAPPDTMATGARETPERDIGTLDETRDPGAFQDIQTDQAPEIEADPEPESDLEPNASAEAEPLKVAEPVTTPVEPLPDLEPITPLEPSANAAPVHATAATVAPADVAAEPAEQEAGVVPKNSRSDQARRVATLLAPLLNGLEIGQRDGAGTTLVTVVAPTLSEDAVVGTATRIVPFLADTRLLGSVTQATLTAEEATIVLTPFGSREGGPILVTAVASRASLAWLERLARTAAREARFGNGNGKHAGIPGVPAAGIELRAVDVPGPVRELAGSLTAFGPVTPSLLRDHAGGLSACLFSPSSLDALPLARFARDLHDALQGAEVGRVASVSVKFGAHRLILRALDGASGNVTMLVGVGRIDRPGLARIELDRAAARLAALGRS